MDYRIVGEPDATPLAHEQLAALALFTTAEHVTKAGPDMIAGSIRALATEVLILREHVADLEATGAAE